MLGYVWAHVLVKPDLNTLQRLLSDVMASIPDEDAPRWVQTTPYGDDALSALAYTLTCLKSGDSQDAAWTARRLYDALDCYLVNRDDLSPSHPDEAERVAGDPLVQAELERQVRDLAELDEAANPLSQPLLDRLRRRSLAAQAIPLSGSEASGH